MSKNAKLAWSLLGLGAGMVCVVALVQSSNSIEKSSIVALVVLGGLFFSFGSYGLRLFHAPFPIGTWARAVLILGIVWGGMAWLGSSVWPISCSLAVDVTSTVIARVHLRAKWVPSGQTEVYKPLFQDFSGGASAYALGPAFPERVAKFGLYVVRYMQQGSAKIVLDAQLLGRVEFLSIQA